VRNLFNLLKSEFSTTQISKAPVVEDDSDQNSPLSEDEGPVTNMTSNSEFQSDPELNLSCCIVMLDILLKQVNKKYFE